MISLPVSYKQQNLWPSKGDPTLKMAGLMKKEKLSDFFFPFDHRVFNGNIYSINDFGNFILVLIKVNFSSNCVESPCSQPRLLLQCYLCLLPTRSMPWFLECPEFSATIIMALKSVAGAISKPTSDWSAQDSSELKYSKTMSCVML